jgi:L-fucose mutarotase
MLKGIDNRLNAEVLGCLRAMGHGDVLILCDTNFPADSIARQTAQAILSVYPLDTFVDDFAGRMEIVGDPRTVPPVQAEVQAAIDAAEGKPRPMIGIERFAFYGMAKKAYAVIQTGERRFYGCFMFRKGVIPPDA